MVNAVVDTENGFTPGTWTRYSIPLVPEAPGAISQQTKTTSGTS